MSDIANATPSSSASPAQGADWLAVQAQAPGKSLADIYSMGVDPNTTSLQDKGFYKNTKKMQTMFANPDGSFNDKAFNQFYDTAAQSLNDYQKGGFSLGGATTDLWEDTSVARSLKAPINKQPVKVSLTSDEPFTNLKTAQKSFLGLNEIGKWTQPKKSIAEVAEGQKVLDGTTGKELDYAPEDTNLFNLFGFFNDPLVLSTYDSDEKDEKGRITHHRGETKFDAQGLPRYETLAGRDVAGKQVLSRWNTLTREASFANKFDFMDSDDLNKSITGTLVKGAVELLPLALGGPVSEAYKAYYIASNLIDATAQIGKSIDGILNNDAKSGTFYKWANSLQGVLSQQKTGMSEHGRDNMFSIEGLANQAVDAVMMMTAQNSVFTYPSKIRIYQMAKALDAVEGSSIKGLLMAPEAEQKLAQTVTTDFDAYMAKYKNEESAAKQLLQNVGELEKYGKYSGYMATAYMAATMATGITAAAKSAGLNDRDTGMLYLGYMGALSGFFSMGLGKWVQDGLQVDELGQDMNAKIQEYGSKYLPQALKANEDKLENTGAGRGLQLLAAGRGLGKNIAKLFNENVLAAKTKSVAWAAVAGGLEMGTLEAGKAALEGVYNGLQSYGLTSTKGDARFDLTGPAVLSDIGSGFFGGALGGGIFHVLEKAEHEAFKSTDLVSYILDGHTSRLIDKVNDLQKKGQLGSTNLSITPLTTEQGVAQDKMWAPVSADNPVSQNAFIGDRMLKTIKTIDTMVKAYRVDVAGAIRSKNLTYQNIVDTSTDTDLRDKIHSTFSDLINTNIELAQTPELDGVEASTEVNDKRAKVAELAETLAYLQGDKSMDEYFRQGLFNLYTPINSAFGVKTRVDFAKEVNPLAKSYAGLSPEDKSAVDNKFRDYKSLDGPGGLKWSLIEGRKEYDALNVKMLDNGWVNNLELYKLGMKELPKYIQLQHTSYNDALGKPISVMYDTALQSDFLGKLAGIKYIPDRIYDQIKERLDLIQGEGARSYLGVITPDVDKLREGLINNFGVSASALNDPFIKQYIEKMLGKAQFDELLNSTEYQDLRDNKAKASDYSLLRVLKGFTNYQIDDRAEELRIARKTVDLMTSDDIDELLNNFHTPGKIHYENPELVNYMTKMGVGDYLQDLRRQGIAMPDLYAETSEKDLLKNMLLASYLEKTSGKAMTDYHKVDFIQDPRVFKSFMVQLLADGEYVTNGVVTRANTLQHLDTAPLDEALVQSKAFDANRVSSPLAEMLEPTVAFINDQYLLYNDNKAGSLGDSAGANYLDRSREFADQLDSHINGVRRAIALVDATVDLNPLVNDFRTNNPAGLSDEAKGEKLLVVSNEDGSYLKSELQVMLNKLQHLKNVNEYNKNNTLARLLRESGLDLASKYQTLQNIAAIPAVVQLLPALNDIFTQDKVQEYSTNYKTASEDLRNDALYQMAKYEDQVFQQFQSLSAQDKSAIINASFKPIDVSNPRFYETADGEKPYNEYAQTIYLAKIFGTSTMDFYKRFAGEFDDATKLFSNLAKLQHVPFPNQEAAVRLAHLMSKGDRHVISRLFNAYATEFKENDTYNFDQHDVSTFVSNSVQVVWGDPGTGKTTAVLLNTINILDKGQKDILLLAPETTQVKNLVTALTKEGFEDRIDNGNSKVLREFLKGLSLKVHQTDKDLNIDANDDQRLNFSNKRTDDAIMKAFYRILMDPESPDGIPKLQLLKDGSFGDNYTLRDEIVNTIGRYKLIAIDEYTHINPIDLGILHRLVDFYNSSTTVIVDPSKRVTILEMGDPNQMGYLSENGASRPYTDLAKLIISQPLTTSLRSGKDLVNNTLADLRNRAMRYNNMSDVDLAKTETLQQSIQAPIRANYTLNPDTGSVGIRVVNKQGPTNEQDVDFITRMKSKFTGGDLIYVVNSNEQIPQAEAILRSTLGDNWNIYAQVLTPRQVQGSEYKYAIIDATPNLNEASAGSEIDPAIYNLRRVHTFLNTMLSRASEATLYLKDSAVDPYVKFDSKPVATAIEQIKLDKETKDAIKADKQALMLKILQDYLPKEEVPGEPKEPTLEVQAAERQAISPLEALRGMFEEPTTEPRVFKGKPTDIISHNSYSTVKDFDTIFKLRFPNSLAQDIETDTTQKALSRIINSYKYYILHANRDGIGDRQIQLRSEFQELFDSHKLDWENPSFYLEAGKRGEEGLTKGRSELTSSYPEDPNEIILSVKLRLSKVDTDEDHPDEGSVDLTMGFLSDINSLATKEARDPSKDSRANFFSEIKSWINKSKMPDGREPNPTKGQLIDAESRRWQSGLFTKDEWENTANVYGSRIIYDNKQRINLQDLRDWFFDFTISEPQVVVANLLGDNNKSILDPDDNNEKYKEVWDSLKGKAVSFISDVYELNTKSAKELLGIYTKQLSYFNTPEFAAMGDRERQEFINSIPEEIKTVTNVNVRYRPNLVKLIKLDNPTSGFLDFRERFMRVIKQKTFMDTLKPELLEQFNTSIYVKDRLVKSLLTLQAMLKESQATRDWFQDKVIKQWNEVADEWINNVYREIANVYNNGEAVDRNHFTINEAALEARSNYAGPMTLAVFRDKLDDLLSLTGKDTIFRGKYDTLDAKGVADNRKKKGSDLNPNITEKDLRVKLTSNKRKDYAGSLIDIKLFNLFKKTRNANFAGIIDIALRELSHINPDTEFGKYSLARVFKDGKIESIVVAKDDVDVDHTTNVIADATGFGGDFSFQLGKLTHPFYAIDFDKLLDKLDGKTIEAEPVEVSEVPTQRPPAKVLELSDIADPMGVTTLGEKILNEAEQKFNHDEELLPLAIEPLEATALTATYRVKTSDGSVYEMQYDMKTDLIKTTPISIPKEADPIEKLKVLDKDEMKNYRDIVSKMFGDVRLEAVQKEALTSFEKAFRHTMISTNMQSMAAEFNLKDYDSELANYNIDAETASYDKLVAESASELRPIRAQLENLTKYIRDYTPKLC